jgi:hypothetical protein
MSIAMEAVMSVVPSAVMTMSVTAVGVSRNLVQCLALFGG